MSGRRIRTFLLLAVIGAVAIKVLGLLRARVAPDVSRHPTVDGGVRPTPADRQPVVRVAPVPTEPIEGRTGTESAQLFGTDGASPAKATPKVSDQTWAAPVEGACPSGYPVKAKLQSGIFHLPGMALYERTNPDRCYPSADAAQADGLRVSKR